MEYHPVCRGLVRWALAMLITIGPAIGASTVIASTNAAGQAIGEVRFARGKVSIVSASGVERAAAVKTAIFLNDKVACGAGSKLEILFTDESTVSLGEHSEIVVDEYVYSAEKAKDVSFVMRLLKGVSRIVTGAITKANPERFKVHTRMATVGIRGCEIGIRCGQERSDVYVIRLGMGETVLVETTSNGKPMMDIATGQALDIDAATRRVVNVDRAGAVVAVTEGKGFLQRSSQPKEIEALTKDTSHLPPAQYEPLYGSDWSIIQLRPSKEMPPDNKDEPK